jgi:hypothetical protein
MTEAELWDQFVEWMMAGAESVTSYFSVMFAFLVMAYFVGSKLSRLQARIVSTLFIWLSFLNIYAAGGYLFRAQMFKDRLSAVNPDVTFWLAPWAIILLLLMMLAGMCACLFFLLQTRKTP